MRTTSRGLLAAFALTPLLAGCFSSGGSGSAQGSDGGRLRVALAVPPAQALSPYSNDATVLSKLSVTEGLTALDKNGAAAPALATSWKQTAPTTWTFDLRKATFQDGTSVTAASVVNALDHANSAATKPRVLSDVTLTAKADDPDTVTLTTKTPDPVLPLRLASPALGILSAKAYGANGAVTPVGTGTGPFEITKLTGKTSATLDRYDSYWGGKAKAPGVDVTWIADGTARANALRGKDVDVAEWIPTSQAGLLDAGARHEVPSVRTDSLVLNTRSGTFADAGLRATARDAVDGSALVKSVFGGYADAGQGLFGPAVSWAAADRVPVTGRAAAVQVPKGTTVRLATYTNRTELPEAATVLQQQLEKAGFTVKQDVREYTQMEADLLAGKYDALVFSRVTLLDTGDAVAYLASDFTSDGVYNIAGLKDARVDAAIKSAAAEGNPAARHKKIMQAEAEVLRTDAVVPLVHEKVVQGISADVEGVALDPRERTLITIGTHLK
ncbi:ABC transporter substrate-binding protein [Streptomyces acidiscabies]|uniref:ABC transporter substrate-binding protein n=1 Tax=Streptomyces acidiscabies TaxID=42234 RepID=A0AAP6BAT2_9ACTN|nr:ABC transporter substrate-binding protein [Streptomyces acidiscabies]MBZ3917080.1 ABC transporter substrate-binding protein [Streptomyces acidiscabies]MDX2961320.1 ABC transporter substrate-binding protein [Streptomyces acidiscabies]MDX3022678.1 ABC transporter substrate-binding protein [Streptomyces acidiscabies]MDX3792042.1 ABC transporter substrate-binding protein [Streptomyces acidiscabies]GAQ50895.1 glutathione-binding protein GsiB precursor [Streptomyces acidiscabies]